MARILATAVLLTSILVQPVYPAGSLTGEGMLTAVVEKGVIIDGEGYLLSSKAAIRDGKGKKVSIEGLPLPVKVLFEYTYTPEGPVVTRLQEIPQVLPR